ncbi:Trafficking protein particle complex subunit BET5 [Pestalotiopsis sp. IQ-011]
MAKGGITKKRAPPSKHSREARRATEIDIDTDKSLKEARAPAESIDHRPSVLAIHQGAGVSKKQKRGRAQNSRAKKRQESAQDKAIAVIERTENKVEKSKDSSRNIQRRRKDWGDINKAVPAGQNAFAGLNDEDDEESDDSELDDEMAEVKQANVAVLAQVPSGAMEDDDDGVL